MRVRAAGKFISKFDAMKLPADCVFCKDADLGPLWRRDHAGQRRARSRCSSTRIFALYPHNTVRPFVDERQGYVFAQARTLCRWEDMQTTWPP